MSEGPSEAARRDAARARFAEIAARPDEAIDVAEAALWLAAEDQPGLDVDAWMARLDALARELAPTLAAAPDEPARVEALNRALFGERGFRGNAADYYDPRNSYLDQVIERRTGIPITLCVLWIALARRNGLDAHGVGFPGHFLAKVVPVAGGPDILVDAFLGEVIDEDECRARLRRMAGEAARLEPAMLRAATAREILLRMLANLKQIHVSRRALPEALACCDRHLLLVPEDALEYRIRGLLYRSADFVGAALLDLERFLELAPDHESADEIRKLVAELSLRRQSLH